MGKFRFLEFRTFNAVLNYGKISFARGNFYYEIDHIKVRQLLLEVFECNPQIKISLI